MLKQEPDTTATIDGTTSTNSEWSRWFYAENDIVLGVVLLVHGLNQRPSSWQEMILYLNRKGLHVYRLALKGHRGLDMHDMETVHAGVWEEELREAVNELKRSYPDTPRYLMGFSMGALLALTVQLKDKKQYFDRQVLFAPAVAVQHYTRLVLPICQMLPSLPSRSPRSYVANSEGTTAEAYRALFQLEHDFRRCESLQILNIPTLVLMRSDDELISYKRLLQLIRNEALDNWRMVHLTDDSSFISRWMTYRHLIVDRESAGEMIWSQILRELDTFFATTNNCDMRN
ncbi:alpha/beta hydrolase [Desulfopila aestuarii]|uniref:Lysophospholipase, alpha-beta hydrolase superfamily n=1 Tax=Desulfopila aestuarii DSM 18488 TaxID=1121416 RepID=A0A1M7Y3A3_9BACT|nr:alpha/beta fold hydrolase [Desulfopila aestuarii]SHO46573.1 Lysophospholipase, alpha-beta hydrolase superfamily [Desulfopila aestuarii DSM 18488]